MTLKNFQNLVFVLFHVLSNAVFGLSMSHPITENGNTELVQTDCEFAANIVANNDSEWLQNAIKRSEEQLLLAAARFSATGKNPRTFEKEKIQLVTEKDWTSGFFPGSLWYLYEITGNVNAMKQAEHFTSFVESAKYRKDTHDLGFILNCSYGNAFRITGNDKYKDVLIDGANSLMTRYDPNIGLIKSWNTRNRWNYVVIIDNMMNLELLLDVSKWTKNTTMKKAAVSHANKTLKNHFRSDYSSYHAVNFDSITGKVLEKVTHQGYSNSSAWSRGQAWALYGYVLMYRETKSKKYLRQAENIANFILNHPNLPDDKIPFWDFNAANIPNEPRDASSAAIIASALFELSIYVKDNRHYFTNAEFILKSLSSDKYLAKAGENGLFILKHSTGSVPGKFEVDTPLSYADYYYLEAMKRYLQSR